MSHQLLAKGWLYPTFYSKLYVDLRDALASTAVRDRKAGTGVWAQDGVGRFGRVG